MSDIKFIHFCPFHNVSPGLSICFSNSLLALPLVEFILCKYILLCHHSLTKLVFTNYIKYPYIRKYRLFSFCFSLEYQSNENREIRESRFLNHTPCFYQSFYAPCSICRTCRRQTNCRPAGFRLNIFTIKLLGFLSIDIDLFNLCCIQKIP